MRRAEEMSEADFRAWVAGTAVAHGWLVHQVEEPNVAHPNLWLVRAPEVLAVRVKSERSKVADAQAEWLDELEHCPLEVAVWRPSDMRAVFERLTRKQEAGP